ncbi:hypothetical protein FBU30_010800 [Linnemannia zychae]|nr:hypothetical protein FBU30_010800 [Linnemannia zychae]
MHLALKLPEILYRIGLYLDADQVLACSLVCQTFYNAFSPLVWNDLHISPTKMQLKIIREKSPLAREISFRQLFNSNELERDTEELISILQDRAPWMRSLTIHQHDSVQQFSSFGPKCNRVERMSIEGIPQTGECSEQTYWKSCKALLKQNRPDLRSLSLQNWKTTLDGMKPLPGQPVWNPILACTQHLNLTALSLVKCKIRGKHLKAFWTISARLESLELEQVEMDLTWMPSSFIKDKDRDKDKEELSFSSSSSVSAINPTSNTPTSTTNRRALPPPDLPPRFPKLKKLTIRFLQQHHPLSQFYWLVLPCPSLRTLIWVFDRYRHFPTQPFIDAFEDTPTSPTAWPDLDSITIRGHCNWISDENHYEFLTTTRKRLRRLDLDHHAIQPKTFEILQSRHFATIQTIDLTHSSPDLARKWIITVLESCPSLEKIKAKMILGQDIIKSRPWACQGLQEWIIAIDMDFDYLYTDNPAITKRSRMMNSPDSSESVSETETGISTNSTNNNIYPRFPPTTNGPKRRLSKYERQLCRAVYKRFSTLTNLREFNMLHSHAMNLLTTPEEGGEGIVGEGMQNNLPLSNPNHPTHRMISLPLHLHLGLHYLARLERLEKFCFWNGYMPVRHKEIEWVIDHWKSLKQLSGGFSIPNRMIRSAYTEFSWSTVFSPLLKASGIGTEGSRYQHYDDSAELLAAEQEQQQSQEEEEEEEDGKEERVISEQSHQEKSTAAKKTRRRLLKGVSYLISDTSDESDTEEEP